MIKYETHSKGSLYGLEVYRPFFPLLIYIFYVPSKSAICSKTVNVSQYTHENIQIKHLLTVLLITPKQLKQAVELFRKNINSLRSVAMNTNSTVPNHD